MPRVQPGALRLLLFCALLLNTASLTAVRVADSSAGLTCAGNFSLRERACYLYSGAAVRRSFHHAERHCTRLRASLASLLSPGEESFVAELVENGTAFWIGLTDQAVDKSSSDAQFRWTDGSAPSAHSHWREGEPGRAGHLHCVQADRTGWALARGGCASTKLPFVCKKLACPKGLEWGGNGCDIITHPPTPFSSSPLPFLCHPLTVLLVLCAVASLAVCRHYQTTEPGSKAHRTTAAHHHHNITPHNVTHTPPLSPSSHVQDLYDPT